MVAAGIDGNVVLVVEDGNRNLLRCGGNVGEGKKQ